MIITERMKIYPISIEKLKEIVENERNEILKLAYLLWRSSSDRNIYL